MICDSDPQSSIRARAAQRLAVKEQRVPCIALAEVRGRVAASAQEAAGPWSGRVPTVEAGRTFRWDKRRLADVTAAPFSALGPIVVISKPGAALAPCTIVGHIPQRVSELMMSARR
jgi:hypothetical protein